METRLGTIIHSPRLLKPKHTVFLGGSRSPFWVIPFPDILLTHLIIFWSTVWLPPNGGSKMVAVESGDAVTEQMARHATSDPTLIVAQLGPTARTVPAKQITANTLQQP